MLHYCLLDRLPVELLHSLFAYFLTSEILFSFSDVSDYINVVFLSYITCRPNFKSIQKSYFDLVCRQLLPEHVISLTLSDNNDTPGQSQLFLSRFQIEQLTRLQSLALIKIEFKPLLSIFSNLHKLDKLRYLSFNDALIRSRHPNKIDRVYAGLINSYIRIIHRLNYLDLNSASIVVSIPAPHVCHLKLYTCAPNDFKTIFQNTPQLKSLTICLDMNRLKFEFNLLFDQLIQLNLTIENSRVSMDEIEYFLSNFPYLKYFALVTNAVNDLADGNRWQRLTKLLTSFKFSLHFDLRSFPIHQSLDSFRSSFWLEEKRWYVTYQRVCLFSMPPVVSVYNEIPYQLPIYSTESDMTNIYDRITNIIVDGAPAKNSIYFPHIKRLVLRCFISLDVLSSILDLHQVEHLIVWSLNDVFKFIPLECTMSRSNNLTIAHDIRIDRIDHMETYQLKQIRRLKIHIENDPYGDMINELFHLFPCIEYLIIYMFSFPSDEFIVHIIDAFKHLSNISFFIDSTIRVTNEILSRDMYSIIQLSRRLTKDNFTYRAYKSSDNDHSFSIH